MTSEAVLQVQGASASFGARKALDGVSLSIGRGEMVALIGPSGSGKSTLLRALTGLTRIDAGEGRITAFGQTVQAGGKVSDQIRGVRARIGMVFQQFNLVGRLSLFSNVALGMLGRIAPLRGLLGLWPAAEKVAVMQALARVGVADQAGQRAQTLSGGQQQRGAIARALVQGAEVILADEPVASLDPVAGRRVMELLCDLNRDEGLSVVVSLHQVDYALRYCRRVIALKAGKVAYDGPSEGLDHAALIDIYGPEIEEVFWEGDRPQ
ncbi:phosphonate ABC transporter ATP-binding protein [Phenylobacterium montanum]|uniref:Phosphonate ABC transporter ATP-binding protein n=1 Tax=Phenylobacterium montanum TaxID=2823693 RepID=A0A975IUK7_9CAUL|nr:phosphonate ABC transporter ATP-binding protein [Caulobacter sp. S6]QUD87629.1 phosphonate ABC transporter ATP-binding protein [Caulobacter sp. S6]